MRIWNISGGCLVGVLACSVCVAFGQEVSANVPGAAPGQAANSSVSASIDPVTSATDRSGGTGSDATFPGEAEGQEESGMGALAGSGLEERRSEVVGSSMVGGASSFRPARFQLSVLSASQKSALKRVAGSGGHRAPGYGGGLKGYSAVSVVMSKEAVAGSSRLKVDNTRSPFRVIAEYSSGFADSTRGTAVISPPDPGTASPLDWSPDEVSHEFTDMLKTQFLNPTLQISQSKKNMRQSTKKKKAGDNGALSDGLPSALSPSLSDQILNPPILNPPDLESPLDQLSGPQ